jgi:tape measure domain-containing protein
MAGNDINIRIGAKLDGLQRDIKKAQGSLTRFASFAESTGRDLSTRLSLPILGVGAAAVASFAKFERMELSLKALADEGENTSETLARLREIALLPGISLEQAAKGAAQLRAVGFEARQAEEILKGLSKAVTLSGEGPEQLGSVVRQLTQMSSKGRILQEDLSVIQENVPSVALAIKDAFGTNNIEAIQAAGVSAQGFTAEIIKAIAANEKFQKATGGLSNEFDNFKQSVDFSLATLGKTIAESINLSEILNKVSQFIGRATKAFSELSPETRKFIVIAAGVAAAIGPVLFGFGAIVSVGAKLVTAVQLVVGVVRILSVALFGLAANPVGAIVVALGFFIAAIVTAYKGSKEFRATIAGIGATIKQFAKDAINALLLPIKLLGNLIDGDFDAARKNIQEVFGTLTGENAGKAFSDAYNSSIQASLDKQTSDIAKRQTGSRGRLGAGTQAEVIAARSGSDLNQVFANIPTTLSETGDADGTAKKAKKAAEAFSIYSDVSEKIVSDLSKAATQAQLTGTSLREMAETSGLQFELGKSVEELGLKIQKTPPFLFAGAEALKAYSEEIALAAEKNSVFGNSFGLLNDKVNITKTALSEAVEQFGANSAEVGFLKEQLLGLNEELVKVTAQQERIASFVGIFDQIGTEIENLASKGALSFKTFASAALSAIGQVIGALIKQGVAAAVANAFKNPAGIIPPVGLALAGLAGAGASALFQGLIAKIKPPGLAAGGIIPPGFEGDRFPAMLNSGEAVIPLDKLFRVLGNGGGPTEFVVRGADLVAVMGRAQYNNNRTGI